MTRSAKKSSEMQRNTNTVTYLQLFLYVTPHVKMPPVVRDILLCDMYGISSNLGDQLFTRLETESSQFRNLVS